MKINRLKIIVLTVFTLGLVGIGVTFQNSFAGKTSAEGDVAAEYKKSCQVCHNPKAEKFFDPSKSDNDYIQVILKGKKTAPVMPGYEEKGLTAEQAKELAVYMRRLRICIPAESNTSNTNAANTNSVPNANAANTNSANTAVTKPVVSDEIIASYKKNCQLCHSPKAEKFFDTAKADAELAEIILNGKKGAKPPNMPEYKSKGITAEQAIAHVAYMRQLKSQNK